MNDPLQAPNAAAPQPSSVIRAQRPNVVMAVVIVLILAAGGAAAYGFTTGKIDLTIFKKPPTVEELIAKVENMTSARIATDLDVSVAPRDATIAAVSFLDKEPPAFDDSAMGGLWGSMLFGQDMRVTLLQKVPADLSLKVSLAADWAFVAEKPESNVTLSGNYSSGGLSADFDLGVKVMKEEMYVRVTKLPIPLVDLTPVSGKWVKFPGQGEDMMTIFSSASMDEDTEVFGPFKAETKKDEVEKKNSAMNELRALFVESFKGGAIKVSNTDSKAKFKGVPAWKYELSFDPARYREIAKALYDNKKEKLPGIENFVVMTETWRKNLDIDEKSRVAEAMLKNLKLSVYVDKKTGMPTGMEAALPIVPDEAEVSKLKDKQVDLKLTIALSNINQPVVVTAPSENLTLSQAMRAISGITEEEHLSDIQRQVIDDLRKALRLHYEQKNSYPAKLDDLIGFVDVYKSYGDMSQEVIDQLSKKVIRIPADQFTNKPFGYALTETGYSLTYELKIPKTTDSYIARNYVEGLNTATETITSKESVNKDADKDGLTDKDELNFGTNPNKADTDDDGFSDKTEVDGEYDPLTNSQTGKRVASQDDSGWLSVTPSAESNDSKRVADIKQIQTALELYYADNGKYPSESSTDLGSIPFAMFCDTGWEKRSTECGSINYMTNVPRAPFPPDGICTDAENNYTYTQTRGGEDYALTYCISTEIIDISPGKHTATSRGIQ